MSSPTGFYPASSLISGITLGVNTVVTFTASHDFTVGEVVSFRVSQQYGTVQLNNQQPTVTSITPTTITVPIDSRQFTPFIASPTNPQQLAMVVPSSSGVVPRAFIAQTNLQDAFDNLPED